MRKTNACVLLACLLMAGSAFASPAVTVQRYDQYYGGNSGGEFTLTPNAELASLLGSSEAFQSFCIEKDESVTLGDTYTAQISYEAQNGGVNTDLGDSLSDLTAYLYSEFRAGSLDGYDFDDTGVGRKASAAALQNVIWYIEEEIAWNWAEGSLEDTFYDDALAAVAGGWTNNGRVVVLNLYNASTGAYQQDMLAMAPTIPAPGAIVLGALGSSIIGFLRRRHLF